MKCFLKSGFIRNTFARSGDSPLTVQLQVIDSTEGLEKLVMTILSLYGSLFNLF